MAQEMIVVVRTGKDGFAVFGRVDAAKLEPDLVGEDQEPQIRQARDNKPPHHPQCAVLITVTSGWLDIFVPGPTGEHEYTMRIGEGERVLFCDYQPAVELEPNDEGSIGWRRHHYFGHRSVAGESGCITVRRELEIEDYRLAQLGWWPVKFRDADQ